MNSKISENIDTLEIPRPGDIIYNTQMQHYGFVLEVFSGKQILHPFIEVLTDYGLDEWYISESDLLVDINEKSILI